MSKLIIDNIFRFWAKLPHSEQEKTTPKEFHPLICHMLDVAIVTREMWRQVLPSIARQTMANALEPVMNFIEE